MQLKPKLGASMSVRGALATAAAGLLASGHAGAQDAAAPAPATTIDTAVLFYHEVDRVQATEPVLNVSHRIDEDSTFSFGITADSLTGATPLGAVPSTSAQSYVRPYKMVPVGTTVTTTSASGGSTVTVVPAASGATTQTLAATTVVPANTYPLDHGFTDRRVAGHAGWEQSLTNNLKLEGGVAYSKEHDYRSQSGHIGLSQDFNGHNTTLNAAVNYEADLSFPLGGTPTPLTPMSGDWKGPDGRVHEIDALVGVTQVMGRHWLSTLSYSFSSAHGYQTDPYKLISVVDATTGEPTEQLYESRPDQRRKQSVFFDNKVHLTSDVISASLRAYKDDWGIKSLTADLRYRWQMSSDFYVEPHLRHYAQGKADFFHYYLVNDQVIPEYASADTRLGKFHAQTYGVKVGMALNTASEVNVRVEYYDQHGNGSPAGAIGQLRQQNLFPDLKAYTVLLGYTFAF
ncbi:MAG: DUF3570 domain-containing protein [Pseudomonadota bacterium]|nr:DUF3570 domain-containing protein [Pseudomonadota bacterium]